MALSLCRWPGLIGDFLLLSPHLCLVFYSESGNPVLRCLLFSLSLMPFAVCLLREFAWPSSRRPSQHSALPTRVHPDAQKHSSSLCLHQQLRSVFSLTITHTFSPERQCYIFHSWRLVMLFQPYRACTTIHYVNCTSVILHTYMHTRTSLKLYQCKSGINMNIWATET